MDALTRREKIISGENIEPLTREEWFLKEYGGGGGGGTTVVANPSGTASADLTKLQVGNDIYGIPSGGAGRFMVTFTIDYDEPDNWSCDKTYAAIRSAYDHGEYIDAVLVEGNSQEMIKTRMTNFQLYSYDDGESSEDSFTFIFENYTRTGSGEDIYDAIGVMWFSIGVIDGVPSNNYTTFNIESRVKSSQ